MDDGLELTTHRTNPTEDTDGDHMPDGWEITYELNPLTADGEADLDDDGAPTSENSVQVQILTTRIAMETYSRWL